MLIKNVNLTNFRNYTNSAVDLSPGLNIILGENGQGKTNFLEVIELLANGRSSRTTVESDFINHDCERMHVETSFRRRDTDESLALTLMRTSANVSSEDLAIYTEGEKLNKRKVYVNGVSYSLLKKLRGRLIVVTFNSSDLHLLRSGPSFRRDWLDSVIMRLKPAYYDQISKYQKIVQQRNRLLKNLSEDNRLSAKDYDQLEAWSEQAARHGAIIIRWRLKTLRTILPKVQYYLAMISDQSESLAINYRCQSLKSELSLARQKPAQNYYDKEIVDLSDITSDSETVHKVEDHEEQEIISNLLYSFNKRKTEEIARKQTLCGPHRDDILFFLNGSDATAFASQGQQRSLVLALKLSELDLIADHLLEPPVLLLDDVLAELDPKRQSLLMSQINDTLQTIVSTTHLSGFNPQWLSSASFYEVKSGTINPIESEVAINADRANITENQTVR
jgi:DNA replication and repair protein RecF